MRQLHMEIVQTHTRFRIYQDWDFGHLRRTTAPKLELIQTPEQDISSLPLLFNGARARWSPSSTTSCVSRTCPPLTTAYLPFFPSLALTTAAFAVADVTWQAQRTMLKGIPQWRVSVRGTYIQYVRQRRREAESTLVNCAAPSCCISSTKRLTHAHMLLRSRPSSLNPEPLFLLGFGLGNGGTPGATLWRTRSVKGSKGRTVVGKPKFGWTV